MRLWHAVASGFNSGHAEYGRLHSGLRKLVGPTHRKTICAISYGLVLVGLGFGGGGGSGDSFGIAGGGTPINGPSGLVVDFGITSPFLERLRP